MSAVNASAIPPPWTCDKCHRPIETVEDGWVQWTEREASLVHHDRDRCLYRNGEQYGDGPLAWFMPAYFDTCLANLHGLDRLLYAIEEDRMPAKDGFEIIRRLHVPGYERMRGARP